MGASFKEAHQNSTLTGTIPFTFSIGTIMATCKKASVRAAAFNTPSVIAGKTVTLGNYAFQFQEYVNGQIAVQVYTKQGEPYARLTTALEPEDFSEEQVIRSRSENQIVVKTWSENQTLVHWLRTNGSSLFEPIGELEPVGMFNVTPELWRVKLDLFKI
jgi:hypothetical protein